MNMWNILIAPGERLNRRNTLAIIYAVSAVAKRKRKITKTKTKQQQQQQQQKKDLDGIRTHDLWDTWAIKPTGSWSYCELVKRYPWGVNELM